MAQDTGKFRKNLKDQFYTQTNVAAYCVECILAACPSEYTWVEPSAGDGVFLRHVPSHVKRIALDIDPKADGIHQQDYLTWTPPEEPLLVFGNPPFGRQSVLAKSFITKSCQFASVVAFILPRSFTKPSMYQVFPLSFHLIHAHELNSDSFLLNGNSYDVPCVFQIWQKKDIPRPLPEKISPQGFRYVKDNSYHFACRRVGVFAGKCYLNYGTEYSIQSHYFIRLESPEKAAAIVEKMNQHVFPSNTVGPRSLSQTEINVVLNGVVQSISTI